MKFKYDDGGRADAGYKGQTGDCGTRAIAIVTGMNYQEVYELVNQRGSRERMTRSRRKHGRSSARTGIYMSTMRRIMEELGWEWVPTMRIGQGCRVHLRADELPPGRIVCRVSKHYVAVIDGVIHDTYDGSRAGTRCVYGYWHRKEIP